MQSETHPLIYMLASASYSVEIIINFNDKTSIENLSEEILMSLSFVDRRLDLKCVVIDQSGNGSQRLANVFDSENYPEYWNLKTVKGKAIGNGIIVIVDSEQFWSVDGDFKERFSTDPNDKLSKDLHGSFTDIWEAILDESIDEILYHIRPEDPGAQIRFVEGFEKLIGEILQRPIILNNLSPRKFEEIMAEAIYREGYDVTLTPPSKDGGRDIIAVMKNGLSTQYLIAECKRYAPNRPVGVEIVRALYGVVESERATTGLLITTSRFTKGSKEFAKKHEYRLDLHDRDRLISWLGKKYE